MMKQEGRYTLVKLMCHSASGEKTNWFDTDEEKYSHYEEDHCPVCENRGGVHGPCLRCGRFPKCIVSTLGGREEKEIKDDDDLIDFEM